MAMDGSAAVVNPGVSSRSTRADRADRQRRTVSSSGRHWRFRTAQLSDQPDRLRSAHRGSRQLTPDEVEGLHARHVRRANSEAQDVATKWAQLLHRVGQIAEQLRPDVIEHMTDSLSILERMSEVGARLQELGDGKTAAELALDPEFIYHRYRFRRIHTSSEVADLAEVELRSLNSILLNLGVRLLTIMGDEIQLELEQEPAYTSEQLSERLSDLRAEVEVDQAQAAMEEEATAAGNQLVNEAYIVAARRARGLRRILFSLLEGTISRTDRVWLDRVRAVWPHERAIQAAGYVPRMNTSDAASDHGWETRAHRWAEHIIELFDGVGGGPFAPRASSYKVAISRVMEWADADQSGVSEDVAGLVDAALRSYGVLHNKYAAAYRMLAPRRWG